jgi:hypothetical protein
VPVLEDSVADFVEQHRAYATAAWLYPQPEGSPLLEIRLEASASDDETRRVSPVFYTFDRVGPYAARPGPVKLIVNPMVDTLTPTEHGEAQLQVIGVSKLHGTAQVRQVMLNTVVVSCFGQLVLSVFDHSHKKLRGGDWLEFTSLEPVHGFLV